MILPIETLVIALVRIGADATASAGVSLVGSAVTAGGAGACATGLGATGSLDFTGTDTAGCCGTPGSSS